MESWFPVSRCDRALEHNIDLRRNAFLSNIAHTDATVSHLDVDIETTVRFETFEREYDEQFYTDIASPSG